MSYKNVISLMAILLLLGSSLIQAQMTEQEIVDKYLMKSVEDHKSKLGWMSVNFSGTYVNRDNDYNTMANSLSTQLPGTQFGWIGESMSLGVEFGTVFRKNLAWTVGGEYWLKSGNSFEGTYVYTPPSGSSINVTDPKSEVKVMALTTGLQYYIFNAPNTSGVQQGLALRTGFNVGYYMATWDLFDQYQNVNLQTATPEAQNISYKGTAPGLSINLGLDFPVDLLGLTLGGDISYMHLNFGNMAWYNVQDQEIIATWNGAESGRVDLDLSGLRGKFELRRYFSW